MRKIFANLKSVVALAVVAAMTLSVSCMYDDTALTKRVDKVEKDLAALTEKVNGLAGQEVTLDNLLAGKLVITGVATDEAGNTVVTLSNGESFTVLAEGLQYRVTDGVLEISADGDTWVAVSAPAECVVKSVVTNADGTITIVFADGTEFTSAVAELIECEATRSQVYVIAETTKAVRFTINDAVEDINVMNQPFGWSATVEEYVEVEDDDFGGGMMPLAAGGKEYVLNIAGPSKALVNAGMAAKEGVVSVHFNTAAGACKVMNVAVNLAEITLNVDAAGNITITNTMATEQSNYWGEKFTDFADFYIGVMPKALYDAHGVNALDEDYLQWGEFESAVATQRSTGLGNVTELMQYEEGVYEQEVIELTVDQLGGAFWPKYNFEIGGEYVLFISIEGKMTNDGYEIPTLNNAIIVTYKKTIVEAELVEGSEKWNDATYHVSLAGYDNFLLGWITVAQIEEYMSYGTLGSTVEEILPQHIAGYGIMSAGAIIAGNYLDQDINLANLAQMSLMGWAPELSPNTEYYFFVYPFNAQTEMDFYMHEFVAENLKICGTFATAALKAGSFEAGAEFELVMHEEKEIAVNVTFSEEVTSVYYNWYDAPFGDAELAVNDIMVNPYAQSVVFDEYTTSVSASKYEYYGLPNPVYLAIVALNANGEYVYIEKDYTYVEPQLPQVEITSFEYVARSYELDDNPETGGGDFVYDITCANGETFRLGLYWSYADAATGAINNGTYNYCYNALNAMYGGWDGFVIVSDTYYYDSKLIVSDDQIVLKLKGIAEYVFNKNAAPVEPEEPEVFDPFATAALVTDTTFNGFNPYDVTFGFENGDQVAVRFNTNGTQYLHLGAWQTDNWQDPHYISQVKYNGELATITACNVAYENDVYTVTMSVFEYTNYNTLEYTYTGAIEGLNAPEACDCLTPKQPEGGDGDVTNITIINLTVGYDQAGEKEMQFWYSATNAHVIDFKGFDNCQPGQPLAAGSYSSAAYTIDDSYCIYDYGTTNGKMTDIECEVTLNADGTYTYDAKFTYNGQKFAFVYTGAYPVSE